MNDGILIPLFGICGIVATLIIYFSLRHKERLTVIEKGMSPEDIRALYSRQLMPRDPLSSLKWGMLLVFGGLAILIGNFLHDRYSTNDGITAGLVILMVGLALVIFYGFAAKHEKPPVP